MKSRFPILAAVAATLAVTISCCDQGPTKVRDAVSEIQRDLHAPEREEITNVILEKRRYDEEYGAATKISPEQKVAALISSLEKVIMIDVTSCPEKFRHAWYGYRTACQELARFSESIPLNDSDAASYQLQKLFEGKFDGGRSDFLEQHARLTSSYETTWSEVVAVAKEYGFR